MSLVGNSLVNIMIFIESKLQKVILQRRRSKKVLTQLLNREFTASLIFNLIWKKFLVQLMGIELLMIN